MNSTVEIIEDEIRQKRSKLESLKAQEEELKKLRIVCAEIPKIQSDLSALQRTLAILQGEEPLEIAPAIDTIPILAAAILREIGRPMNAGELQVELAGRGKTTNRNTVMSVLHREVRKGKAFKLTSPGKFGLIEWII